jgi:signal transduction histidine kinase
LLAADPTGADELLAGVTAQAQSAIADVRHLVYALRPPALDDLGLVGALRAHAARAALVGLSLRVDAPDRLPPLPAAVEVAAYRIVQEALTNVLHHAQARSCQVTFDVTGLSGHEALAVEVRDDGVGLPPERVTGVGLQAMHERAAEVGGTCTIERVGGGGTRVSASLPI